MMTKATCLVGLAPGPRVIEIAWRSQQRLHHRRQRLHYERRKPPASSRSPVARGSRFYDGQPTPLGGARSYTASRDEYRVLR